MPKVLKLFGERLERPFERKLGGGVGGKVTVWCNGSRGRHVDDHAAAGDAKVRNAALEYLESSENVCFELCSDVFEANTVDQSTSPS
jgi:hypothetical protein